METLTKPTINIPVEVDAFHFYEFYFELQNIGKSATMRLSKQEITVAAILCTTDLQLTTSKAQHGHSQKYILAEELLKYYPEFQTSAIYGILGNLKRKKVLVEQGRLLILNKAIHTVKSVVNNALKADQHFEFTYALNFTIDQRNLSTGSEESAGKGN